MASTTTQILGVSAGLGYTCAIRLDGTVACWGAVDYGEATPPEGTFSSVSAGGFHTCAVRADGSVMCWGNDFDGMASPPSGTFKAVSTGDYHTCGIRTDGTLACWGDNEFFQSAPPSGTYTAVDAGSDFACALRTDGSLACWGNDENHKATPPAGTFTAVTAGWMHGCALRTDGTVACWGYNGSGRASPPSGAFAAVSAGASHTCGIRGDGTIACWGENYAHQSSPPAGTFDAVSAGDEHSCARATDRTLACWGDDYNGAVVPAPRAHAGALAPWSTLTSLKVSWSAQPALADVTSFDVRYDRAPWNGSYGSPVMWKAGTAETTATLAATAGSTYCFSVRAHDADGRTSAWSDARDDDWSSACTVVPLDDRSLTRSAGWTTGTDPDAYSSTFVRSTTAGATLTRTGVNASWMALVATTCPGCGTVQLFLGGSATPFRTVSLASPTIVKSKLIPVYQGYWDDNDNEVHARGTLTIKVSSSGLPVTIDGLLTTTDWFSPAWADGNDPPNPAVFASDQAVSAVSAGYRHTCAIKADGSIACWGGNDSGKAIPPAGTFVAVSVGVDHTCAIRSDGTIACWGSNVSDQLHAPDGTFTAVSAGATTTCAVRTDGQIACWGYNLEEGAAPPSGTFTALTLTDADDYCGLRGDGSVSCWGEGYAYEDYWAPSGSFTAIGGPCGVHTDGTLECWGEARHGMAPPTGTFTAVSAGWLHGCAIRDDGRLACWGDNEYFEATPPAGTFTAVDAGEHHTCAIGTDQTLSCWGQNRQSQVVAMPEAAIQALATWIPSNSLALSWRGSALAGIASYEVRYRRAPWNGALGAYTTWRSTTATSAAFPAAPGSTYCFSVRTRDTDGRFSPWVAETCTATPLDDRSLARSGSWTAGTGASYYKATSLTSTAKGAALARSGVTAKRISIVATTCPTCGSVKVYLGSTLLKTVNLSSASTVNRKVIPIAAFSSARAGTVKIVVASTGKKVIIDGVGVRRY